MLHWIPQSSSHLHLLVSVFPSVGLVFGIGLFIAGVAKNNEAMKRTCLAIIAILGLLAIPTYLSGDRSMAVLASDPGISQEMLKSHNTWGLVAIGLIGLTGVIALFEFFRSLSGGRTSAAVLNVVLILAFVTLAAMAVVDDFGFEINHRELVSPPAFVSGISTPQWWSKTHMILNHFPTVGFVTALGFYIIALLANNDTMKRAGLVIFVICGALVVPTYVTGTGSMWALTQPAIPGISKAVINAHRDAALVALFGLAFTGGASWIELWRSRHLGRLSNGMLYTVLIFALITLAILAETGHRGGQINHPEIRVPTDVLPTDPNAFVTPAIELLINNVIWFVPWQTVHFFGYSLIFGTALAVVLRVLGFWKTMSFAAVHRLLPLGFLGVMMNVFTGMLMLLADSYRYIVTDTTFAPKMALIPIGVMAVLYFSLSDSLWKVKAGEEAPASAKAVALLTILAWSGVIIGGRLLPYL